MEDVKNEIYIFLAKIWMWVAFVFIGVVAKFSYDVSIKKKYTWVTFTAALGIALFVGYITSAWCRYKGWQEEGMFIVPLATLLSEKLVEIAVANAHKLIQHFTKWKPSEKDDDKTTL